MLISREDTPEAELVNRIFQHFDSDNAGTLDQAKLRSLVSTFNQGVVFTDKQLAAITEQICEEYSKFSDNSGLTREGLTQIYRDGVSDLESDLRFLGLDQEPATVQEEVQNVSDTAQQGIERNSIDFEPEPQADPFAILMPLKPIAQPMDAQSDTAMSIEPRIDSTLVDTPKLSTENLTLEALEGSLGLKRAPSGAESIIEFEPEQPTTDRSLQDNTQQPPLPLSVPEHPAGEMLPETSQPTSPLNLKLKSPTGPHVAEIVQKLEEASSPPFSPPSRTEPFERRSMYFTPMSELRASRDGSYSTPGEKRKTIGAEKSPRPPKQLREEAGSLSPADDTGGYLSPDEKVFQVTGEEQKEDFKRSIARSADAWAKASPGWQEVQVSQASVHMDSAVPDFSKGITSSKQEMLGSKSQLPSSLSSRHRKLFHNLSTDSRASDRSTIQAHMDGIHAEDDETDDVFDEAIGPTGQVLKFPSAISIEDRHSSLKRDWSLAESRMTSGASEILEAVDKPELRIEVPPEINRVVEGAHLFSQSPASISVAEQEAQVGYESLDSQDISSYVPSSTSPARASTQFKESPVKLMRAEMQSLLQIKPSSKLLKAFQSKIESRCSKSEVYDLHMELGRQLAKRGNYKDAVNSYKAATDITEDNPQAFMRLGNCLFSLDRYTEAESAFRRGLEVADAEADLDLMMRIHTNLGITLEAIGLLVSACGHYRKATELCPSHARAFKLLGGAHYALANLELAKYELEKAIALDNEYADAYCDLGCCLCALGDIEEAKETFKKALRFDERHIEGWFNLGNLERQSGEFKAALQCYQWVLCLEPKHWRALLNSAVAFIGLRRPHEAQTALQKALKLTGNHEAIAEEIKHVDSMSQEGATLADLQDTASTITTKMMDVPSPIKAALTGQPQDRRSEPGSDDSEVVLNIALLNKLGSFSKVATNKLYARAQARVQVPTLTQAEAEVICHTLLQSMKPRTFTAVMSCVLQHVLPHLEHHSQHTTSPGWVDRSLFLGVLIVMSQGLWEEKLEALWGALSEGQDTVYLHTAASFVNTMKAIFTTARTTESGEAAEYSQVLSTIEALESYVMSSSSGMPSLKELGTFASRED